MLGFAQNLATTAMRTVLDSTTLVEIFIAGDDLSKKLSTYCLENNLSMDRSEGEMMRIVIYYHHWGFRCFKYYYEHIIQKAFKSYFPTS